MWQKEGPVYLDLAQAELISIFKRSLAFKRVKYTYSLFHSLLFIQQDLIN